MTSRSLTDKTMHTLQHSRTRLHAHTLVKFTPILFIHIRSSTSPTACVTGLTAVSSHRLCEYTEHRDHRESPSLRHGHYETRILKEKALADSEQNNPV